MRKQLEEIHYRINRAAHKSGRHPGDIRLVAVSKTHPAATVEKAIMEGISIIGENYIKESRRKIQSLSHHPVSWHFIGHLQTNKARYAVKLFDLIHSVDSVKLAKEINKRAMMIHKTQAILIQVNIAGETSKSGISQDRVAELLTRINNLENISVWGLMTIPPFFNQPEKARPYFKTLRELRHDLVAMNIPNITLNELSMGMTGDFEVAIQEGATLIRVGTAIFGERK